MSSTDSATTGTPEGAGSPQATSDAATGAAAAPAAPAATTSAPAAAEGQTSQAAAIAGEAAEVAGKVAGKVAGEAAEFAGDAADAIEARWKAFGPNERIAVVGGLAALVGFIVGIVPAGWNLALPGGLPDLLAIAGTIITFLVIAIPTRRTPDSVRSVVLRIAAGTAGAFAIGDIGDLAGTMAAAIAMDYVATVLIVAGIAVMAFGVWRMTGGNLIADAIGLVAGKRSQAQRLLVLGAALVVVMLAVLRATPIGFVLQASIGELLAVLAVAAVWLANGSAAQMKMPIASNLVQAALAVVSGVLLALFLLATVGNMSNAPGLAWLGIVGLVAATAAMVAGGVLGLSRPAATPAAAAAKS